MILGLLLAVSQVTLTPQQTDLIDALIQVESNGNDDAVGDNGNAIGCLQIWKIYHTDATERSNIGGEYLDCYKRDYAILVFDAYMRRYARSAWTDPLKFDAEKVARIHNGGPKGYKKKATEKYWKKVLTLLRRDVIIGIMKSINYYDSSYSPNEACEQNDNYMDCGACNDMGMIDEQVYCDCRHGKALAIHDYEDETLSLSSEVMEDTHIQKLYDNYRAFGEC
mgnify:FL=1